MSRLCGVYFALSEKLSGLLFTGLSRKVGEPIHDFQTSVTRLPMPQCVGSNFHQQIRRCQVAADSSLNEKP
jgi:hypothetical protein